ncbi:cytidylate kinase family protein [Megamonas hypermegale]|uniref:cytidylate kinase family protein n=1 Tax=Megamonas hypermegale TaxID=158847 RepID=UPI00338E973C
MRRQDAERAGQGKRKKSRYYNYYTGRKWGEPANYDLVVNTGRAPLNKIADAIIKYIDTLK